MLEKIRKHAFKISVFCLLSAILLLVIATATTSWLIIRKIDDIHIPRNISSKFPEFKLPSNDLELKIEYSFGLAWFCVKTYNVQLKSTEKSCSSIGVFKRDLDKAILQDAMKFQILCIVFLVIALVAISLSKRLSPGHLLNVMTYIGMVFMFFSGTSSISAIVMVKNTLTEKSSIVKYNILAHLGKNTDVDLKSISSGESLYTAVAGNIFIVISLTFFIASLKGRNDRHNEENVYRLLSTGKM